MEQSRARIRKLESPSDCRYAARQYRDYAIAKEMQDDLKVMAYTALGNLDFEIKSSKEPTNFDVCNKDNKYHWFCYVNGRGYMFLAQSEIGLYCKIISSIVGDRLYIPFSN
jgi:hypothetical protein